MIDVAFKTKVGSKEAKNRKNSSGEERSYQNKIYGYGELF